MGDPFVRPGIEYAPHIEQLVLRHHGTGTSSTTREEWLSAQHRDTLSTLVQRYDQLLLQSVQENVSTAQMKRMLLEKMLDPCRVGLSDGSQRHPSHKRGRTDDEL